MTPGLSSGRSGRAAKASGPPTSYSTRLRYCENPTMHDPFTMHKIRPIINVLYMHDPGVLTVMNIAENPARSA